MHYLYIIINKVNQKVYIGQTENPKNRWSAHKCEAKRDKLQYPIYHALRKYGIDNFIFELIATCRNQEDANEIEAQLIKQYDSRNIKFGYNLAPGGKVLSGPSHPLYGKTGEDCIWYGKHHTEESKQKMSEISLQQIANGTKIMPDNNGRTCSKETKQKLSEISKNQFPEGPFSGKTHSEESKRKMSKAAKKRWNK